MKKRFVVTVTFALLAATVTVGAIAQYKTMQNLWSGIEASPDTLKLPSGNGGVLTVSSCRECKQHVLRTTSQTVYRVNEQDLGLKEFGQALTKHPTASVVVVYAIATSEVTRVAATY